MAVADVPGDVGGADSVPSQGVRREGTDDLTHAVRHASLDDRRHGEDEAERKPPPRRTTTATSAASHTRRQFLDQDVPLDQVEYLLKTITFNGERCPIVCQTTNGACPILSIANFLSLSSSGIGLPRAQRTISAARLTEILADFLLSRARDLSVVGELEGLHRGMNVDPIFDGVDRFVEGKEVMRAFGAELVHGWLPAPESPEYQYLVGGQDGAVAEVYSSFEAAQIQVLTDPDSVVSLVLDAFFSNYPNNMTPTGLQALRTYLNEGEMSILFFNAHFSLLYKHPTSGELYTLVTDAGYLDSGDQVVWESLELSHATQFYSSDFIPRIVLGESLREDAYGVRQHGGLGSAAHEDEDARLARQLHEQESGRWAETDEALARRMQGEEDAETARRQREQEARRRPDNHDGVRRPQDGNPATASGHAVTAVPRREGTAGTRTRPSPDEARAAKKKDCCVM